MIKSYLKDFSLIKIIKIITCFYSLILMILILLNINDINIFHINDKNFMFISMLFSYFNILTSSNNILLFFIIISYIITILLVILFYNTSIKVIYLSFFSLFVGSCIKFILYYFFHFEVLFNRFGIKIHRVLSIEEKIEHINTIFNKIITCNCNNGLYFFGKFDVINFITSNKLLEENNLDVIDNIVFRYINDNSIWREIDDSIIYSIINNIIGNNIKLYDFINIPEIIQGINSLRLHKEGDIILYIKNYIENKIICLNQTNDFINDSNYHTYLEQFYSYCTYRNIGITIGITIVIVFLGSLAYSYYLNQKLDIVKDISIENSNLTIASNKNKNLILQNNNELINTNNILKEVLEYNSESRTIIDNLVKTSLENSNSIMLLQETLTKLENLYSNLINENEKNLIEQKKNKTQIYTFLTTANDNIITLNGYIREDREEIKNIKNSLSSSYKNTDK